MFLVTDYYTTGLQHEIPIFLFIYTGHNMVVLVFIYILFSDIDTSETEILNLIIKQQ
jgi:hypothetical protein